MSKQSPSINPEEIEKFSAMAEDWWNPNGKFKPLHKFNPTRIKYIRDTLIKNFDSSASNELKPLAGLKIIDIGCGGGLLSIPMARLGAEVTGIDASEKNIKIAQAYATTNNVENVNYICTSAEDLAEQGQQFDVVLNMEVIEHVEDVSSFMQASSALLRKEGLMFVATLNRTPKSYLFGIVGAEYVMRWLPKGTHDWKKFLKPSEINNYFEENNIKHQESTGVKYDILKDTFSTTTDLSVNFMMLGKKG